MVYYDNNLKFALRNFEYDNNFTFKLVNRFNESEFIPLFTKTKQNDIMYITLIEPLNSGFYDIYINNILTDILYV
jgi:hypothetical protein